MFRSLSTFLYALFVLQCFDWTNSVVRPNGSECGCSPIAVNLTDSQIVQIAETGRLLLGDMHLNRQQVFALLGNAVNENIVKKWPDNVMRVYVGDISSVWRPFFRLLALNFRTQMDKCLKVELLYKIPDKPEKPYLHVTSNSAGGCFTTLGFNENVDAIKPGGSYSDSSETGNYNSMRHSFNLPTHCWRENTVTRLMFIAAGMIHENMREDRDQFVKVQWQNIRREGCLNFAKCYNCEVIGGYDVDSITQIPSTYMACTDDYPTLLDNKLRYISYVRRPSPLDYWKLKRLYGCYNATNDDMNMTYTNDSGTTLSPDSANVNSANNYLILALSICFCLFYWEHLVSPMAKN